MAETISLTREELYKQVWTTPVSQLAIQYGISNVALGKLCRRMGIPTPGRGDWARRKAGQKLKRPALPKAQRGQSQSVTMTRDLSRKVTRPGGTKLQGKPPEVPVPETLAGSHEVVRRLAKLLQRAPLDEQERLVVGRALFVTPELHRRALLILDGLCKALERRGHTVALEGDGPQAALQVAVGDHRISFSISEALSRVPHDLSPEEKLRLDRGDSRGIRKYDHIPSGQLRVDVHQGHLARSSWSDRGGCSLERSLGHVILAVEAGAAQRKEELAEEEKQRVREDERRRREHEEHAQAERQRKLKKYRQLLADDLEAMAADWNHARQIQEFLDAYEAAIPQGSHTDVVRAWLEVARKYAGSLDPLSQPELVARDLDPDDDVLESAIKQSKESA